MSANQTDLHYYYSNNNLERKESRSLMEIIPFKNDGATSASLGDTSATPETTGRSSTCATPRVQHMLQSSVAVRNSLPGTRDNASATTLSLPRMWLISKSN